jgi:RHS repeat-associated protein
MEHTPYGELWIEKAGSADQIDIPYRFSGKERDSETGLYYYGARYLDSKAGRWLSTDPALGEYIPEAPIDDEARKRNGNLPGMGGVYNMVNMHLYHYAGNNPLKYTDPDGNSDLINNISIPTPDDFIVGIGGGGGGGFGGIANIGEIAIISGAVIGVSATASQALKDDNISTSISDTTVQTKTKQDRVLYHYTNTPPSGVERCIKAR